MTGEVCFIDTETLGLDADVHPIWEVALIDPDGQERTWQVRVTPRDIDLAHPIALEIGRFAERYDETDAVDPMLFCIEFEDLTRGCHLAGAVVSFDEERLRRMFWREGIKVGWHYHLIDVEALAVGWLRGYTDGQEERDEPYPLPWKSDNLSREIGVEPPSEEERHTALGDARWAKRIYEKVMSDGR